MEYKIHTCHQNYREQFVAIINRDIQNGWSLQGGICCSGGELYQAMVKDTKDE